LTPAASVRGHGGQRASKSTAWQRVQAALQRGREPPNRATACNNHEINLLPLPPVNLLQCRPDRLFQPHLTRYKAVTTNFQNLTAVKASQNPFFHNRLTY
jgi:hypothetical protein